jgi:hypothetical protein
VERAIISDLSTSGVERDIPMTTRLPVNHRISLTAREGAARGRREGERKERPGVLPNVLCTSMLWDLASVEDP